MGICAGTRGSRRDDMLTVDIEMGGIAWESEGILGGGTGAGREGGGGN
jgi:hypothetical protein